MFKYYYIGTNPVVYNSSSVNNTLNVNTFGENIAVYITPYGGIELRIKTVGYSLAVKVKYTIYESSTKGGTYKEIDSTQTNSISKYIIKIDILNLLQSIHIVIILTKIT